MDIVKGGIVLLELDNWLKSRLIPRKESTNDFVTGHFTNEKESPVYTKSLVQ